MPTVCSSEIRCVCVCGCPNGGAWATTLVRPQCAPGGCSPNVSRVRPSFARPQSASGSCAQEFRACDQLSSDRSARRGEASRRNAWAANSRPTAVRAGVKRPSASRVRPTFVQPQCAPGVKLPSVSRVRPTFVRPQSASGSRAPAFRACDQLSSDRSARRGEAPQRNARATNFHPTTVRARLERPGVMRVRPTSARPHCAPE